MDPASTGNLHVGAWHSGGEERRAFLQERITLIAKLMFLLFTAIFLFGVLVLERYEELRPERFELVGWMGCAGSAILGATWLFVRRGTHSERVLYAIDLGIAVTFGAFFGLDAFLMPHRAYNLYLPLVFNMISVFGRALIVPSTPLRGAVVATAAMAPLSAWYIALAVGWPEFLGMPRAPFVLGIVVIPASSVVLAAFGTRVIYGLRKQARDAMRLGQYTLDRKLGEGGMGTVYRARHAMLRRPAAIKLLRADQGGAHALARFEREVQLTAELTHPNTIAIFDYGTSPDGVFYYVMEYLDGLDLEQLVESSGPQPAPRVVHILMQVCAALTEAHRRGLIHRDVKPANIILCERGDVPDVVKVLDFGLVKELGSGNELTGAFVAGTPDYLAPEIIEDQHAVGPASDLYAVGALGYYLLTGKTVFEGTTIPDICVHHVHSQPIPPSQRVSVDVPAGVEAVVLRCLAKRPEHRYASARELRDALAALPEAGSWTESDALAWWSDHEAGSIQRAAAATTLPMVSSPLSMTVDLTGRGGADDAID
jgi:serine/threonine-protein kinase